MANNWSEQTTEQKIEHLKKVAQRHRTEIDSLKQDAKTIIENQEAIKQSLKALEESMIGAFQEMWKALEILDRPESEDSPLKELVEKVEVIDNDLTQVWTEIFPPQ